jgi:addiction module HigA family antidote
VIQSFGDAATEDLFVKRKSRRWAAPAGGWNQQGIATHPGEVLEEEFLEPMGISRHKLALDTHMPATRVGEIVRGRRAVSPDTALRLARYFGTSPEFWLNLQQQYDLSVVRTERKGQIEREVQALA